MIGSNNRQSPYDPQAENDALQDRLTDDAYEAFMSRPPLARPGWKYPTPPRPSLPAAPDNLSLLGPTSSGVSKAYTPAPLRRSEDAGSLDLYGPAAGVNYNAGHEIIGHGLFDSYVPGVANGSREAYANSFAGSFAQQRGAPYPSNEQLRDRGGWAPIPPWRRN